MTLGSLRFLETFCAVVETGNFTQAAVKLGMTPAAVSRAVARHEAELAVQLFQRTTRRVQLTEAGRRYFERCSQAMEIIEDAQRSVVEQQEEAQGLVRISVPATYGHYRVLPLLGEFLDQHPRVTVELDISAQNVDLLADRFDLVVRMGPLPDSNLIARKLEDAPIGIFASPRYLAVHGQPASPEELDEHSCITFERPSTGKALPWLFLDRQGRPMQVTPRSRLRCAGDVWGCVALARLGAGLIHSFRFMVEEDLRAGRLVEVLREYSGRTGAFTLLQPAHGDRSLAVRRLAEFVVGRAGELGGGGGGGGGARH